MTQKPQQDATAPKSDPAPAPDPAPKQTKDEPPAPVVFRDFASI